MEQPGSVGWRFACPDWQERLKEGRSLVPDLPLDEAAANRAVDIFNMLRLPDVVGQPPLAEAAGEWHRDIVRAVFGSLDKKGHRKVPELFALVPKKNAKTTGGAAIMLTALLLNRRPRAEFLFVGPTQEVADLAFQQAAGMIDADPEGYLQKRFLLQEHIKTITDRLTKSKLKIKTFDMKVMTGAKPVGVLVDELHLMSSMSYAMRVVGQIRGGMIANPEAFLIFITTQSDVLPAGVFRQELEYARAIRDGKLQKSRMLPMLYEFPEAMQRDGSWRDTANWRMVLPNLGRSITLDRVIADHDEARAKGEEETRRWASQHLNIEMGVAMKADGWAGAEFWTDAEDPALTLEEILIRSEVVVVGIDGGGLDDLFGVCVLGRCRETRDWLAWTHSWCHESVLERRKSIASRLEAAQADGELTIVEHAVEDIEEIVELIDDINRKKLLACVAVDPAGIGEFVEALRAIKITQEGDQVIGAPQGYAMMNAIKTAERKVENGTLKHAPNKLMDWCVGNVKIEPTATAIRATKQNAGDAKIDPWMALMDAVIVMVRDPKPKGAPEVRLFFA